MDYPNTTSTFSADHGYERNSVYTDPEFAVTAPVADVDFNLSATSPNIDRGAPVGLTEDYAGRSVPRGLALDIGAFEY